MILQLQAKVHGLGNLGVLTYTYPIFSWFETPKSDPFLPSSLHDQQFVKTFYIESESGFILVDCLASLAGWLLYQLPCLDSLTAQLAQITRLWAHRSAHLILAHLAFEPLWNNIFNKIFNYVQFSLKNEVEHDLSEGLSSFVFLKISWPTPNLTKLLRP